MRRLLGSIFRAPAVLYRLHLGCLLGQRFLVLHHVGRRSGRLRSTPLEVVAHDQATNAFYVVVGLGRRSDWYQNLRAKPHAGIQVGSRRWDVVAETLPVDQGRAVLDAYQRQHPLAWRVLGSLFGLTRLQPKELAERLPIVRLRPVGPVVPS